MKKLVAHISDPHFGTEDPAIASELLRELRTLEPAVVVISGDLTQRARASQFHAARDWLEHLSLPYVVVPGNHDIPLYDVVRRFFAPRDRYRDIISRETEMCFYDDALAVCGIDTTKSLTTKYGHVKREQIDHVVQRFRAHDQHWRILVAHHPFLVPPNSKEAVVEGAEWALERLETAGVDLILTGHLHIGYSESAAGRNPKHSLIHVQAGTCMSTRTRGEANGYNKLAFDGDEVEIARRLWNGVRFVEGERKVYRRGRSFGDRLIKVAEQPPAPTFVR